MNTVTQKTEITPISKPDLGVCPGTTTTIEDPTEKNGQKIIENFCGLVVAGVQDLIGKKLSKAETYAKKDTHEVSSQYCEACMEKMYEEAGF